MEVKKIVAVILLTLLFALMLGLVGGKINKIINEDFEDTENNNTLVDGELSGNTNHSINESNKAENEETENNFLSDFNFSFLKIENQEANKIYSPLSIKYALKMLEEGTTGDAKAQIAKVIGNSTVSKYASNSNMSFANALFIRDIFADGIKESYKNTLKTKYDAEVIPDSFATAENVNNWISNKTLKLINNLLPEISENENFLLVNALGIDMEWKNSFINKYGTLVAPIETHYAHEAFEWRGPEMVTSHEFNNGKDLVSGMEIVASINNYDIVTELGEDNIRKTVGDEYRKYLKELSEDSWEVQELLKGDLSDENIEKVVNEYLTNYIPEINSNYQRVDFSTDFSFYVDDDVKVFAKDLKEYEGTTLQYIGIMPTTEDLNDYVEKLDGAKVSNIISNLKDLRLENFKNGVVTKITGYIPKFKFDYQLALKEDLQQLGITNVFEQEKAGLTEISPYEGIYVEDAIHKATIEFTQDGIKAAAATMLGGAGGGDPFDYLYEVPVEEIDLTFDKPYMFLIRDKENGEVWFVGTVYEPLLWENEPEKDNTGAR